MSTVTTPQGRVVGSARSLTHMRALARVLASALPWTALTGAHRAKAR